MWEQETRIKLIYLSLMTAYYSVPEELSGTVQSLN